VAYLVKTQFDANLMQVVDSRHEGGESHAALGHPPNDGSVRIVRDPNTGHTMPDIHCIETYGNTKLLL
jgi:hypothetical protein